MPHRATCDELRRLLDQGAQLVEVLEPTQFAKAHLPGAVNLPAWELTRARAAEALVRGHPIVVYCFDAL
jgi:rhodanese-related sulfurtransferase